MTWSPDSSITGGAITGFASPAFTLVSDTPPVASAKMHTVTSSANVGTSTANSADKPFTVTFYKPTNLQGLPAANPLTGLRGSYPRNVWRAVFRKGGDVASGIPQTLVGRLTIDVPAGMETQSPDQIKAFVSFLVGILNEESNDLADTLITGVV